MQSGVYRLKALYPGHDKLGELEIFGYCSKGMPGVEIVGLGPLGRSIKEKLIFLSRQFGIKIPLKRYVLCIDLPVELKKEKSFESCRWLELPILILFWTLSGRLELENLDDCIAIGKIQVNGTIICPELHSYQSQGESESKILAPSFVSIPSCSYLIPLEDLLNSAGAVGLNYQLSKLKAS
ncbi:MAG: hypothetical protein ACJAT2_000175 [Bacteriovoracaceae bacterium]|jgi:hypothetical protein